ncbi:hypothetical protein SISNIDRAFT_386046, partial [Sistotremastrum niveocremeum HHB9708]
SCTLDVLTSLPRTVTSDDDAEGLVWLLKSNGVKDVPSVQQIKESKKRLRDLCGVRTIHYKGDLGHPYYVNSIADLIRLEMSNPLVRPFLHFFPEETRKQVSEAWHGQKWRKDMQPDLLTPMIRVRGQDYFIFEPTLLTGNRYCMPIKWYRTEGSNEFWCKAYSMVVEQLRPGEVAWSILEDHTLVFSETELLANAPLLLRNEPGRGIPKVDRIWGESFVVTNERFINAPMTGLRKKDLDVPVAWEKPVINPWRTRANGKRVMAFMIWLYCDDTSGNRSKKWNEHNSFLFTAAGLPRSHSQKQYNTHFLCTSNCAPPLEMLEGITEQMNECFETGIEAWDSELRETVMVFPVSIADLGDNPMQSEMCCHIGMKGKYYCRKCKVWGKESPEDIAGAEVEDADNDTEDSSDEEGPRANPRRRKRRKETAELMAARVLRACQVGELRSSEETQRELSDQLNQVRQQKTQKDRRKKIRDSGVKDTHLNYFVQQLDKAVKNLDGEAAHAELLRQFQNMPREEQLYSPIWRLLGSSPNEDTPCEILHIILLGIVKYFWRDAIQRLSDDQKETLTNRLSCLSVESLGPDISPISGPTYVKYAGSLVGRDFRVISQVAVFVLYDLLPESILAAWSALSRLVPLVWMPEIPDIDIYVRTLERAVDHFLDSAVTWSPRWMNKPKFHLLKHLPADARRFGPPILYATEGFESFNAVIRDWSVHSNRQAPSRDIGIQAAEAACIRHLMSGGSFTCTIVL